MTHIPNLARRLGVRAPKADFDPALMHLDDEVEAHMRSSGVGQNSLPRPLLMARRVNTKLPRSITPKRLLTTGMALGSLAASPKGGALSRIVSATLAVGSTALAIDLKVLEETEREEGIQLKPGELGEEVPFSSSEYFRASIGLASVAGLGDLLGLDAKRRWAVLAGSVVSLGVGAFASVSEGIDESALLAARMGEGEK